MCLGVILMKKGRKRAIRMLTEHGSMVCLRCRYILDQVPPEGTCPECGEEYSEWWLGEGWDRTYPTRKR
jgi:hypothetical protein